MHPALLLILAVSDNPAAALEDLGRYGEVPECSAEETIEHTEHDHLHTFAAPRTLPSLEGKYAELLPYLEHANRKVVLRAAQLICRTGSPEVPRQLVALARRWPCENELTRAALAVSLTRLELGDCKAGQAPLWKATARAIAKWKLPAQASVARAISAGDAKVLERTLWDLDALDPARAKGALATLAQVDAAAAFLPTVRGLQRFLGRQFDFDLEALSLGVLGAQLSAIAAKTGTSRAAAFCAIVGRASGESYEVLRRLQNQRELLDATELPKAAELARRGKDLTPFGRELLEDFARSTHDWMAGRNAVSKMVDYRDRGALRAYVKDEANGLGDRLSAAKDLARLGDATGLALFESSEGLWPDAYKARRQQLVELAGEATGPVREQAQALLGKSWTNEGRASGRR